jgi:5'-3' exonuclease
MNEAGVVEKFGVPPGSIPDWLALVGDSADGIPGVPRWGARTASTMLARYLHVENIPDSETSWEPKVRGAASLAASLREHREAALLYRTLATLRVDVPLSESLDDLEWHGARRDDLETICAALDDASFLNRITRWR